ncbi:hypothetical protein SAMN02745163_01430 [Clostridium cavendishii DSM 21758]|uniref:Uncharacterized protein n=1 Tax=Clostridium cavendishii DSM 21758 TaxID=1121302 RepID=A0A1M6GYU4_9CLOT|nr:hypothetical protein [Clostridium cavendishii]SHJ15086.1 hypothetical protein SAMN02745163_01430 [Clostridium cavendishii DSM 21758]
MTKFWAQGSLVRTKDNVILKVENSETQRMFFTVVDNNVEVCEPVEESDIMQVLGTFKRYAFHNHITCNSQVARVIRNNYDKLIKHCVAN